MQPHTFNIELDGFRNQPARVCSSVLPVVTHPGRSGTYADQLFGACSKTAVYFIASSLRFTIEFNVLE